MSKKLVNVASESVADALEGFAIGAANPDVVVYKKERIIARTNVSPNEVCIVTGGGSGHEPYAAGFVGKGLVSAAVAGLVFAAPATENILSAIECINSKKGCLVFVFNYTGDRLTFGLAAEKARARGHAVNVVINGDDCATTDAGAGRRGLAGNILLLKIAGAMSLNGASLDEITKTITSAADSIATFGIALTPCSVPGSKATFTLPEDKIELGLGVHGEHGIGQIQLCTAREAVSRILSRLFDPAASKLRMVKGDKLVIIINNLGGLSKLEELIVLGEAIKQIHALGYTVIRSFCGHLMTSLEMSGVQISVLRLSDDAATASLWLDCIDMPTDAPAWPRAVVPRTGGEAFRTMDDASAPPEDKASVAVSVEWSERCKNAIGQACRALLANESLLNDLDASCGDGDTGSTMAHAAKAVLAALDSVDFSRPAVWLERLSSLVATMGGTSGGVYSLMLTAAAAAFAEANAEEDLTAVAVKAFRKGVDCIMRYGGAKQGDRTMLDSLLPSLIYLEECSRSGKLSSNNAAEVMSEAARRAEAGAEATAAMDAKVGRASYVAKSQLGAVDSGARAVSIWMNGIAKAMA